MDREEAADALLVLSKLAKKTRDDTALQNWGLIWVCSAFSNGAGFFGTHLLFARGYDTPLPYVVLWAVVFVANGTFIALFKGKGSGPPSFLDRQTWSLFNTLIGAMALTAVVNYLLGLRTMLFFPAVACVLAAMTFSAMGALMGKAWYAPAAIFAAAALGVALVPRAGFAVLAALWAVTQGTCGALLHRDKLRLARAGGGAGGR